MQDAVVSHNYISVGDDALCVKSGIDWFGREFGRPSQNIVFEYNLVFSGHGGMTIGSVRPLLPRVISTSLLAINSANLSFLDVVVRMGC